MKQCKQFTFILSVLTLSLFFTNVSIKANDTDKQVININTASELQEALDNTTSELKTLKLMSDIDGNFVCAIDENYQAEIDLNDHCITGLPDSEEAVITVQSGALTVLDNSKTKTRHYYEIADEIAKITTIENKDNYFDGGYIIGGVKGGGILVQRDNKNKSLKVENITIIGNYKGIISDNKNVLNVELSKVNVIGNKQNGMYISSPLIMNDSKILHNYGYQGAGIAFQFGKDNKCALNNCIISDNHAKNRGGGFYINDGLEKESAITLNNCVISNNTSDGGGGGICFEASQNRSMILNNCTVKNNTATYHGGGIVNLNGMASFNSSFEMIGGSIEDNISLSNQGGGASSFASYSVMLKNVLIKNNRGGGLHTENGGYELANTKIYSNDGFGLYLEGEAKLSGTTEIMNNYSIKSGNKTNCNVLYASGSIDFDSSYNSSNVIGIALAGKLDAGTTKTIVKNIQNENILDRFKSEDPRYILATNNTDAGTDIIIKVYSEEDPSGDINNQEENVKPQNPSNPGGNNNQKTSTTTSSSAASTIAEKQEPAEQAIDTVVKLKKVTNKKGRKLKLTYNMDRNHFEYDIQVATNKKFTKNVKTFNTVLTKGKDIKLSKKYKGKKVYVRVRVNYDYDNKSEVKGKWSKAKTVKIKK